MKVKARHYTSWEKPLDLEEIKTILSCYRPDRDDPSDPLIQEALTALNTQPELAAWYEEECAFDRSFKASLEDFTVPPIEHKAKAKTKTKRSKKARWMRGAAMAASILIALGGSFLGYATHYNGKMQQMTSFREAMSYYSAGGLFMLDLMTEDITNLQQFMANNGGSNGTQLPDAFTGALPMGCKAIAWRNHTVSLYCFVNDQKQIVHAYLIPRIALHETEATEIADLQTHSNLPTAGWVHEETVYLLIGSEPEVTLDPFLLSAADFWTEPFSYVLGRIR